VLDRGFGVEKGLFSTAKEGDPRCTCFGEVVSGLCTDACAPARYKYGLAFGGKLGAGGRYGLVGFRVPLDHGGVSCFLFKKVRVEGAYVSSLGSM